jgi:carbonic anhydrase
MRRNVAGSCNSGQAQSPIDLMTTEVVPVDAEDATMGPVQVKWGTLASFNIKNNGHTVQACMRGPLSAALRDGRLQVD